MFNRNEELKVAIRESGIRNWMVAERLGISEPHFYRIMRTELSEERKKEIYTIISDLSQEREALQEAK